MRYFLLIILIVSGFGTKAQKFALLDEHFAEPVHFADAVTSADKFNDLFPVEKKLLPQFIKTLEEIEQALSSKTAMAKDYNIGCVSFKGINISLATGGRTDYVLTSVCDKVKISMHLCDAKVSNASNAFFINTWIKYIRSYAK